MKQQQIFCILPDLYTCNIVLNCFNIDKAIHNTILDLNKLDDNKILEKFHKIYQFLSSKYRNSIINKYYSNLTVKRCITILKQCLKFNGYKLIRINNLYYIKNLDFLSQNNRITINFN